MVLMGLSFLFIRQPDHFLVGIIAIYTVRYSASAIFKLKAINPILLPDIQGTFHIHG